jgi:hypothetical protein
MFLKFRSFPGLALMLSLILLTVGSLSCRQTPSSPEGLARVLAEQIRDADPQGSGVFFDEKLDQAPQQLVITYRISRKDDQDDVWARKRLVHFIFRPAPDDPNSVGGWYLERIAGDYLEYLGVSLGLQFEWDHRSYLTDQGSGYGIIAVAGARKVIHSE